MKINWKEVSKFLSGAFFVASGANWYLAARGITLPFFGIDITPTLLVIRGCIQFILFLLTFYYGFIRKPKGITA